MLVMFSASGCHKSFFALSDVLINGSRALGSLNGPPERLISDEKTSKSSLLCWISIAQRLIATDAMQNCKARMDRSQSKEADLDTYFLTAQRVSTAFYWPNTRLKSLYTSIFS